MTHLNEMFFRESCFCCIEISFLLFLQKIHQDKSSFIFAKDSINLIIECFLLQLVNVIQQDRPRYIVNVTLENVSAYQESAATNVTAVQEEQRDKYLTVNRVASALIIGIVSSRNSKVSRTRALETAFV